MINWLDGTIPVSKRFGDPYYSKADGLAETRHVFIEGNRLAEAFPMASQCTIAELGFGTGLNFIATAIAWQHLAAEGATLDFISFEKYPMPPEDMKIALSRWPEIAEDAAQLIRKYISALATGDDKLMIEWSGNCRLTIHVGDALESLNRLNFKANAWYLDGFAPSRNQDMWSDRLLKTVFERTRSGGTFSTYTAAGWVRRNLIAAGFDVSRVPGHAGKREMMTGQKPGE